MSHQESTLNDHLLEMGWKEGAASPERVANLLERLTTRNRLMAAVAFADTDPSDLDQFEELDDFAA